MKQYSIDNNAVACTIGHFDGVHVGHQHVVRRLLGEADRRGISSTLVLTFDRLPRTLFDPSFHPRMLTTIDERQKRLKALGVDRVDVLTFDMDMASQSAHDFMEHTLRECYNVRLLILGYDNRFGRLDPNESFADYERYGRELGIEVIRCDKYEVEGIGVVSSSLIRQLISEGKYDVAQRLMQNP